MIEIIAAFICVLLLGYFVLLLRSFEFLSLIELKRRAKLGDKKAAAVYSVRGVYGSGVYILIWSIIGVLSSLMILLLERVLWTGVTVLVTVPIVVLVHAVLPISRYPEPGIGMADASVPVMRRVLFAISPALRIFERTIGTWVSHGELHSLQSKAELLNMIENAKHGGTQLTKEELSIASHSLTFGDKLVSDVYVPMSVVRTVPLDLALSAVAMSELYDTGYSRFPVIGSSPGTYIGVLYTKDLALLGANKNVSEAMRPEVYYVNEQSSLIHVLNGFIRTKHHLYMVVNEFEEVSGIVTIEDVIEQIIGRKIVDEFDKYDDLRAVARQLAHDTAKSRAGTTA